METRLLIPKLTSNDGNKDFIISVSNNYSGYFPYYAFDRDTSTPFHTADNIAGNYLKISMSAFHFISGFTITERIGSLSAYTYDILVSDNDISYKTIFSGQSVNTQGYTSNYNFSKIYKCKYIMIKCTNNAYMLFSELNFFETDVPVILKSNDKYYSIAETYYNSDSKSYNPIDIDVTKDNFYDYVFSVYDLATNVIIGEETFRPIDKFNEFQIVSIDRFDYSVNGIKSKKEMVIGSNYIITKIALNIDFFEHIYSIAENCSIKCAIYDGVNIKTTSDSGANWTNINKVLPENKYQDLTEDELLNWNEIMEEIYTSGFDIKDTKNIDFNSVVDESQKLKFLYVIEINSTEDNCNTSELKWQFDSLGNFLQTDKDDLEISVSNDLISAKALKDMDILKINVNKGSKIINEITNIDIPTDSEIDNMVNEVINNVFD